MGDELLKTTGAGNLFMVFGEPDVAIKKQKDGKYTVEIKGLDIYDPTTGQIRSNSTRILPAGLSIRITTAKASLSAMPISRTVKIISKNSRKPSKPRSTNPSGRHSTPPSAAPSIPQNRKIAIKVINHYGDEVLKVYEVK